MTTAATAGETLAIHGGSPVRETPLPPRNAIGPAERAKIDEVLAHYDSIGLDYGYQGPFEEAYCKAFTAFMGGGHADAVATGTMSVYVALLTLDLPKGSQVLISPITDPGAVSAVILAGHVPRLVDTARGSYNIDAEQVERRLAPGVKAIVVTHATGQAAPMTGIVEVARRAGLAIVEDCSQSHGARHRGRLVGTFGDVAAFSTMYRKTSVTGACGGVVYTRDEKVHHRGLALADRGKPRWQEGFDDRDPTQFLFPAFNLNADELSCGIGLASFGRLPDTIRRRLAFVQETARLVEERSRVCRPMPWADGDSPFIYPILVDPESLACTKREFAVAVRAEGIGLNPHYMYVVRDWPWVHPHLADMADTPNARDVRDRSFVLYLNENYTARESLDTVLSIVKVERHFGR